MSSFSVLDGGVPPIPSDDLKETVLAAISSSADVIVVSESSLSISNIEFDLSITEVDAGTKLLSLHGI